MTFLLWTRLCFQVLGVYPPTVFCSGSFRRKCWTHWTSKDFILFTARWSNTCRTFPKRGNPLLFKENLNWGKINFGCLVSYITSCLCQDSSSDRRTVQRSVLGEAAEMSGRGRRLCGIRCCKGQSPGDECWCTVCISFTLKQQQPPKCFTENETQK